jgi:hypothetical protein
MRAVVLSTVVMNDTNLICPFFPFIIFRITMLIHAVVSGRHFCGKCGGPIDTDNVVQYIYGF